MSRSCDRRDLPVLPPRARRRARALLWKFRYGYSATCLGLAAAVTVHQLSPPSPDVVHVTVANGALPAGTTLTADHVKLVEATPSSMPSDVFSTAHDIAGRRLAVGVSDGTVLSAAILVADDTAGTGPPGTVVMAIRLAEPALARILSPGMVVDLLAPSREEAIEGAARGSTGDAAGGDSVGAAGGENAVSGTAPAEVVAHRALVLPLPQSDGTAADADGVFAPTPTVQDSLADVLVVAVTPEEAAVLANVTAWSAVSAVVVQ